MFQPYSRILVVDDSETARKIIRAFLYKLGFHYVREADCGADALAKMTTQTFDLVISDWEMGPTDGLQLLQAIRRSARWRDLPFIMVTGSTSRRYADAARDNGATFFLSKPFSLEMLGQRIGMLEVTRRAA